MVDQEDQNSTHVWFISNQISSDPGNVHFETNPDDQVKHYVELQRGSDMRVQFKSRDLNRIHNGIYYN